MSIVTDRKHIIIGTAGHIDHGKTRLVGRLTNIETDRLPEEKARGISIDLGFAHWDSDGLQFGVVDVPGHERFVKNMVAGATGVNLALLVVAADDGVMPQTREHLEIMDLLGVKAGVVAVTKTDLVEPDFVELVVSEIEELLAGTFLAAAPILPVSSETGAGLDALRAAIVQVGTEIELGETQDLFRMPIDRVFSIGGHGTVVTGSVLSGRVHPGDTLELLPEGRDVRVRSVQHHGLRSEDAGAWQRTAVNLAGVKLDEIHRGHELATPGYLRPTRRMLVELRSLASSSLVLKDRMELSVHLGTSESVARLVLKGKQLQGGAKGYAELRLEDPLAATYGQRFILRRVSPAITVAGGTVLDPYLPPRKRVRDVEQYGTALNGTPERERLSWLLSQQDHVDASPLEAAWRAGVPVKQYGDLLHGLESAGVLVRIGSPDRPLLIHADRLAAVAQSVMRTIRNELSRYQTRRALPRNTLNTACREIAPAAVMDAVFEHLLSKKELVRIGSNVGPADAQVSLTKNQQRALTRILEEVQAAALTPPTAKELAERTGQSVEQIQPLLNLCVEDGLLVKLADGLYFAPEALEGARARCRDLLAERKEATMSELRDAWGVTRKFSVPLCEFFDAQGVTSRQGDVRTAGPRIDQPLGNEDASLDE